MWMDIAIAALFVAGIYAFVQLAGWRTRDVTRRSNRTAENLYDQYAGSPRKRGGMPGATAGAGRTSSTKGEAPPSMSWRGLTCGLAVNGRRFLGFH